MKEYIVDSTKLKFQGVKKCSFSHNSCCALTSSPRALCDGISGKMKCPLWRK